MRCTWLEGERKKEKGRKAPSCLPALFMRSRMDLSFTQTEKVKVRRWLTPKKHISLVWFFCKRRFNFFLLMTMSTTLIFFQQLMAGITGSMRAWLHSSAFFWICKLHQALRPQKAPINLLLSPLKHNQHKCEIPNHQSHWQSSFSSGRRHVKSHTTNTATGGFLFPCALHVL